MKKTIQIPLFVDSDIFQYAYDRGARIHSNSWGIAYMYYSKYTKSVDEFMRLNPGDKWT